MGTITLSIPQTGLPNSTEDVKVASDLTAIQTLLNGNLDSTNLSPSAGILQSQIASGAAASFGFSNVATSQSTSSATFTALATSDIVSGVVLPANGLIQVWFQATWQESAISAGRAAIFLGANQLQVAAVNGTAGQNATQAAAMAGTANQARPLVSFPSGLVSVNAGGYPGPVTTGQTVSIVAANSGSTVLTHAVNDSVFAVGYAGQAEAGGPCTIFAAAGTYNVGVQFKTSSGTVTASNRKLFVRTLLFA